MKWITQNHTKKIKDRLAICSLNSEKDVIFIIKHKLSLSGKITAMKTRFLRINEKKLMSSIVFVSKEIAMIRIVAILSGIAKIK